MFMSRLQVVLALAAFSVVGPSSWANDGLEERLIKLAHLGPGVHEIKKDFAGRIQSCVIVGQSQLNREPGKGKAIEDARQRAELDARDRLLTNRETQAIAPRLGNELRVLHAQVIREDRIYLIVMHWEAPKAEPVRLGK
jgi:hypothetical protein